MEIERKWFIKIIPDLTGLQSIPYERHFLYIGADIEIRIQKKGDKYIFERKQEVNDLTRDNTIFDITQAEFEALKKLSIKSIIRHSYPLHSIPGGSLKMYQGDFEGLVRAEIEFDSEDEANAFIPPTWFGKEITNSALGKDKKLVQLSKEEFKELLSACTV